MENRNWNVVWGTILGLGIGWAVAALPSAPEKAVHADVASLDNGKDVVAMTKDVPGGGQILYMIDPETKVLIVYEFDPRKSKLKLSAVRHYSSDQMLSEYNNDAPHVAEIEKLVRQR